MDRIAAAKGVLRMLLAQGREPLISPENPLRAAVNRPFPSSCLPPLQNESKCEVFLMKISFHSYVK